MRFESPASEAVLAAQHPAPEDGGPCVTCAFRPGTEANLTPHTILLAKACVEGVRPFYCHEKSQLCRGFIAAVNLRGSPETLDDKRHAEIAGLMADVLSDAIAVGVEADRRAAQIGSGTQAPMEPADTTRRSEAKE